MDQLVLLKQVVLRKYGDSSVSIILPLAWLIECELKDGSRVNIYREAGTPYLILVPVKEKEDVAN